jgi:riboflavin transporter FmnP
MTTYIPLTKTEENSLLLNKINTKLNWIFGIMIAYVILSLLAVILNYYF